MNGVSTSAAPRAFTGPLAADISVVDLEARAGNAELITTAALEHGLHQLVLKAPGSVG